MLGLMESIDSFNPAKSNNFLLFAHVKMATKIVRMLYESGLIKIPSGSYWKRKQKGEEQFRQVFLPDPQKSFNADEISAHHHWKSFWSDAEYSNLYTPPVEFHKLNEKLDIDSMLSCLSEEERIFIKDYFGFGTGEKVKLLALGKRLRGVGRRKGESTAADVNSAKRQSITILKKVKKFLAKDTNLVFK
jgi:DNA-directed RNA polymerase sigma subunit (sigma70/sigma32)